MVWSTLRFTRHRRLGFMDGFRIMLAIILTVVSHFVPYFELNRRSRVNAGEARGAEALLVIGNGAAKIFDGKITERIRA